MLISYAVTRSIYEARILLTLSRLRISSLFVFSSYLVILDDISECFTGLSSLVSMGAVLDGGILRFSYAVTKLGS